VRFSSRSNILQTGLDGLFPGIFAIIAGDVLDGVGMETRAWIGCLIAVIVVALLLNDRPISIAASDTPIALAASDTEALVSKSAPVSGYAGRTWAR
jgi:hypothetical protein